ncbi:MAG TPA: choline/ethanolamine kinase family protein [Alphaproteobacteria bacterium]|nr:choline/ethanolamine kinase family protein [Alphaproteobacteria bacterium]
MTDGPEITAARAGLLRTRLFDEAQVEGARLSRLGGLTNRNWRVEIDGRALVLRIPGEGTSAYIDRRVEKHNAEIAARAGVNAPILYFDAADGVMLCRFVEGATMDTARFRDLGAVARAARAFRRMHDWLQPFLTRFDLFEKMDEYLALLRTLRAPTPEGYERAQQEAGAVRAVLARNPPALAPCHCDPLAENFLDDGSRMVIVDWEYSGMNDPMWDLGDLSVEAAFGPEQDAAMLEAYFLGPPPAEAEARMVLYKAMCDLLWTLWGVIQHANQNPADDFWAYAVNRFERCRRLMASNVFARSLTRLAG